MRPTFALGLFIITLACGARLPHQTKRADTPSALEEMVDVGGYRLYINCTGHSLQRSPTVVMDAGGFDGSVTWSQVQPGIARITRVCVYDRAGLGKSERLSAGSA